MEISNIKDQRSKTQIKNKKFTIFSLSSLLFALPNSAFAHEAEIAHEEVPASVDPMVAIGVVVFIAIGGVIIWKVMFSKKKTPPIQAPQVQTESTKVVKESNQSVTETKK